MPRPSSGASESDALALTISPYGTSSGADRAPSSRREG